MGYPIKQILIDPGGWKVSNSSKIILSFTRSKCPSLWEDEGGARCIPLEPKVCLVEVICGSESFQTGEELESLKGTTVLFVASRYAPDGKMYAQAPSDGTIRLWKTNRSE
jgi:hypothetical protein